jgi:hypothetical protein
VGGVEKANKEVMEIGNERKAKGRVKKPGVKRGLCVFQRKKKAMKPVITRRIPRQNH